MKQAQVHIDANAFTGDGRLLAATARVYTITTFPAKGPGGKEQTGVKGDSTVLTVWDTQTGKALKTWRSGVAYPAFNPVRPLLAVLEPNGDSQMRVGFWDVAAEVGKK
jgi:hypothetical protein